MVRLRKLMQQALKLHSSVNLSTERAFIGKTGQRIFYCCSSEMNPVGNRVSFFAESIELPCAGWIEDETARRDVHRCAVKLRADPAALDIEQMIV